MPEITFKQAKEFLNKINKKDKIAIIHHDDADGFSSGIIFYDHCKSKEAKTSSFIFTLSITTLEKLPLKKFNKIIITDISTKEIGPQLKTLKNKEIFLTDHHPKYPLPKKVLSFLTADQGYIPSSKTAHELTGIKKWLSVIGTVADVGDAFKENQKFIKDFLKKHNITIEEFKKNYAHPLSNAIIYLKRKPKKAFSKISKLSSLEDIQKLKKYSNKVEKEIQKEIKECKKNKEKIGKINVYQINPKYQIKGIVASIIATENPKEPHIFLSQRKLNKKMLGISSRHHSTKANLPKLLESATKNLPDSKFGGHLRASGGQIRIQDLEKFKENLKNIKYP